MTTVEGGGRKGGGVLVEGGDGEIAREEEEEEECRVMDRAGKHFSTSGCSHNAALQVSHPSRLTLGCHLNSWCVKAAPQPRKSVQICPTITQTWDGTIETGGKSVTIDANTANKEGDDVFHFVL